MAPGRGYGLLASAESVVVSRELSRDADLLAAATSSLELRTFTRMSVDPLATLSA